jgi:4-hydroxybenzoate-CoA ligase/benzoate-CoA ligase
VRRLICGEERVVPSAETNSVHHFVDRHVLEGRGDAIAFIDAHGAHTYAAFARLVNQAGCVWREAGVARGEGAMLCLNDSVLFPAMFFGALKIGAIPIPINTLLVADDYRRLLRDSAPRAVALSATLFERFAPALADQPDPPRMLVSGDANGDDAALDAALAQAPDQLDPANVTDDETAFCLYSSGSTGGPKGVLHRGGDLVQTARLYAENLLGIQQRDVIFSASKTFFAYGLGNSMTFALHAGGTAILIPDRPTPETVLAALRKHQVTIFFGFPTLYAAILASLGERAIDPLPRLRICVSAGEALPAAVADRWFARFGIEILDGIGSTETLHIFMSNRPGDVRRGTSGKVVAGYEVALRDEAGAAIGIDQIGDLWCRGPSLATGYWNNPNASRHTFVDGWIRTGDKYLRDADGYYHYAGRADDMLKVGGAWVSPHEVESALMDHPMVLEAAVVAHADHDALIKPKAFVVLKDHAAASSELAAGLQNFVKERLAPYKYPRWIEFRTELPKTATGKIRRNLLRNEP